VPEDDKTKKKIAELEKDIKELKEAVAYLLKKLRAVLRTLVKKYPTIINHSSGDGNPIPRNQDLQVQINSNVTQDGLYEVAIIDESGAVQSSCSAGVTFPGGNPGSATIPMALLGGLAASTDYVLVCWSAGGGLNATVVQHQVDIVTGA
jgi:hypothetical protein